MSRSARGGLRSREASRALRALVVTATAVLPGSAAVSQESPARWIRAGDTVAVAYWAGDSLRAERVLGILRAYRHLPALPDSVPSGAEVYLAPDEAVFDSLTGGGVPEWGAGVAVPGLSRIVLPAYASERTRGWSEGRTLRHEWAHLGLHQYLAGLRVPRWLDEGYAEWASGGWNATQGWRLSLAFATGSAPPLDSLTLRWPRARGSAELAYMLSATAVEYLAQAGGERGLALLFARFREGEDFEAALRGTFGVTSGQFEEDWQDYVRGRYGWLLFVSNSLVSWGVLALLLVILFWIRRRRDREHMARLRATDPPEKPAYWTDDSEKVEVSIQWRASRHPSDGGPEDLHQTDHEGDR